MLAAYGSIVLMENSGYRRKMGWPSLGLQAVERAAAESLHPLVAAAAAA